METLFESFKMYPNKQSRRMGFLLHAFPGITRTREMSEKEMTDYMKRKRKFIA